MAERERASRNPIRSAGASEGTPQWTVTRREHTATSPPPPLAEQRNDGDSGPFHTRTVTTTERVQILQMPVPISEGETAPALLLALSSPNGNTTQSVSSTVTTLRNEGTPLIGGMTASGVPLYNGIHMNRDTRQTTTVITTTTTTYRVVELTDSDSMTSSGEFERDFEMISPGSPAEDQTLTIDIPLGTVPPSTVHSQQQISEPRYLIVGKTESSTPGSPSKKNINIELDIAPIEGEEKDEQFEVIDYTISPAESMYVEDQVASTSRSGELVEMPLRHMVDVYHPGTSDTVEVDTTIEYDAVFDEEETVIPDRANASG
ncbi:unnamed protein product, partial [Mesorhabditis belari]|uniref:Uncharacterized protein n=1 Tax=Mesorhabditis belari TaxID=2138241 RepID=A0AAF3FFC7_9BILA